MNVRETIEIVQSAPLSNLIVTGLFIIIGIVLIPVMIIYLKRKTGITKIGPVDFEIAQKKSYDYFDQITTCQHYMDDEIQDIDDLLHQHCHDVIESIELHITNILRPILSHGLLIESVVARISLIFTASIIRNHFTRELSQDRYIQYRTRIRSKVKDHYINLYERVKYCEVKIVSWEEIEDAFGDIIEDWLNNVRELVKQACLDKIEVYERYKTRFFSDKHRIDICDECIEKNNKYIRSINSL
jgi:hypothetical protein